MNPENFEAACSLVPRTYVEGGQNARRNHEKHFRVLLQQRKLPEYGWSDMRIELLLQELALMDSNNYPGNVGVGEREGRVISQLVARRHYRLSHGVGRSGDVTAIQPKAAGSSLLAQLTNQLLRDLLRKCGVPSVRSCVLLPVATGMSMMMVLLALRQRRPQGKYVLWPRIDQKSCFKCILSAGLEVVVIENLLEGDELRTNLAKLESELLRLGPANVLCVLSTTSCFAPRVPDRLSDVAKLCKTHDVPHVVNNAYGIQSTKCMHLIQEAHRAGRVDAFVQSSDKNLMVPVGGAIVASSDEEFITAVAQTYPGRASASPAIDVFITLLSLSYHGYHKLVQQRKDMFEYLRARVGEVMGVYGERVLTTPHNPISMAVTLSTLSCSSARWTELGSQLFVRQVSGIRVIAPGSTKSMGPHSLVNWGAHTDDYPTAYFTVAAAIGMTRDEVDQFCLRLDKTFKKFLKRHSSAVDTSPAKAQGGEDEEGGQDKEEGSERDNEEVGGEDSVGEKKGKEKTMPPLGKDRTGGM